MGQIQDPRSVCPPSMHTPLAMIVSLGCVACHHGIATGRGMIYPALAQRDHWLRCLDVRPGAREGWLLVPAVKRLVRGGGYLALDSESGDRCLFRMV